MTKGSIVSSNSQNGQGTIESLKNDEQSGCQGNLSNLPELNLHKDNVPDINIAEYVQNLPEFVRNKIAGFFGTGLIEQETVDIENIEHYLVVSRHCHHLKSVCESKLLSTLNSVNCQNYLAIAEQFGLVLLQTSAHQVYKNNFSNSTHPLLKSADLTGAPQSQTKKTSCKTFNTFFTCDTTSGKRALTTVVLDSTEQVKCYRNIKKGDKISKQFQCCCMQDAEDHPPYVYWSFGKCFYRYDPVLNKYKKLSNFRYSRSKFSLISHNQFCFAIGGTSDGKTVRQIEEYNVCQRSWKTVSTLPVECQMSYSACVLYDNNIYIFSAATNKDGCSQNRTVVCVFDPVKKSTDIVAEIPLSFTQIKACVLDSQIYLASDEGDFIRFDPSNNCFVRCQNQIMKSKDFGMYTDDDCILLAGGCNSDGKCNNMIRKFCPVTGLWTRLSAKLPDCMAVYGTCHIKIPTTCSIIPFYETKLFEIPAK